MCKIGRESKNKKTMQFIRSVHELAERTKKLKGWTRTSLWIRAPEGAIRNSCERGGSSSSACADLASSGGIGSGSSARTGVDVAAASSPVTTAFALRSGTVSVTIIPGRVADTAATGIAMVTVHSGTVTVAVEAAITEVVVDACIAAVAVDTGSISDTVDTGTASDPRSGKGGRDPSYPMSTASCVVRRPGWSSKLRLRSLVGERDLGRRGRLDDAWYGCT